MKNIRRGFTLIELLIVVAIIGIITAISLVNFINAIQRAKQRRTMGDMRAVATAVEIYQADLNHYPPSAGFTLPPGLSLPSVTVGANMATYVAPTYIRTMPMVDGWNSYFTYSITTAGTDYCFRSNGRDGIAETAPSYGASSNFNADIIFVDGIFAQFPEGVQR